MINTIVQGVDNELCTMLFIVIYFFTMASSIWWVILTLSWFLMAGLKWSHEAVENVAAWFHFAAWAVPAIKTIFVLAYESVEGDVLTGACYVGLWNPSTLGWAVLAPLLLYLLIGSIFLLSGFVSLFRVRSILKHTAKEESEKMARFVVRIGVFSLLYSVPAWLGVACLAYEWRHLSDWMLAWQQEKCLLSSEPWVRYSISCPPLPPHSTPPAHPPLLLYLVKHLSALGIGVAAGCWVLSGKTLGVWRYYLPGNTRENYV